MALKEQHLIFCLDYLKHFNASQAARNAGYSEKTAGRMAWKLLQRDDIQEFLADKRKQLEEQADIELLEIIHHLKAMAFFDIRDIMVSDGTGKIKPISEWPDIACKVVTGMKVRTELFDDTVAEIIEVKIPSREKNTENLGRYVGAFTDNMKVDTGDGTKKIFVFPGFKPGMPIPAEMDGGDNGKHGDNGNGRAAKPEDGGNGEYRED